MVWDRPARISCCRGLGMFFLFPGPNVLLPSPTSGANQLLTSALLTGRGATLGPKSSARPDEPGPGDSAGLGEHLEKYPASHLPCVVTLPVRAAWGRRGKGRIAAPEWWEPGAGPRSCLPGSVTR